MADDIVKDARGFAQHLRIVHAWDEDAAFVERLADEIERLRTTIPTPEEQKWSCKARSSSGPDPQDCDWPVCGCDPKANDVIAALEGTVTLYGPSQEGKEPAGRLEQPAASPGQLATNAEGEAGAAVSLPTPEEGRALAVVRSLLPKLEEYGHRLHKASGRIRSVTLGAGDVTELDGVLYQIRAAVDEDFDEEERADVLAKATAQPSADAAGDWRQALRDHWLREWICDHDAETDVACCACSLWKSEPQPSVGSMIERWIEHVAEHVAAPSPTWSDEQVERAARAHFRFYNPNGPWPMGKDITAVEAMRAALAALDKEKRGGADAG